MDTDTKIPDAHASGIFSYKTIINVPAAMRMQPMMDLALNFSFKKIKAKIKVMTTLSLSMGTTLEASPNCRAL